MVLRLTLINCLFFFSENGVTEPFHAQLEFYVYLVSGSTGSHTREARALRFWFKPQTLASERPYEAQAFFRELVSPHDFPKGLFFYFIIVILKARTHPIIIDMN